ncbi:MAG TPA: hydroxymethylbilane synthase, partial [Bdellovibrionota bacterium]|nr:hydroxymethylbilane synthase [Bdellovibrionota bacterium]
VGTSSARRTALLRRHRPDLEIGMLRGNLDTRLRRLEEGKFDAVVVACAGLERLGRTERLSERLDPFEFVPAVGQGMLAVTCRREDKESREIVRAVNDERAHRLADIERVFLAQVGGGCEVPLGCYGEEKDDEIRLVAVLASFDGRKEIRSEVRGEIDRGEELARQLAGRILDQGGRAMIDEIRGDRAV